MAELTYMDLGRAGYEPARRLQLELVERLQTGDQREFLLLVEHDPPVITLGIGADQGNILARPDQLAAAGIEVHKTRRGGDVTYHGPGQLVAYPILRLNRHGRDVRGYVRNLEEVLIRVLERLGISGRRREGTPGVWVGDHKIAAIGVAIRRWITYHGFALNVSPNMKDFDLIVPCGLRTSGPTSLAQLISPPVGLEDVKSLVIREMLDVFGFAASRQLSPEDLVE